MTKRASLPVRKPWTTPELKRIVAGSAEASANKGLADGGTIKGRDRS